MVSRRALIVGGALLVALSGCTMPGAKRTWSDETPVVGVAVPGQAKAVPITTVKYLGVVRLLVGGKQMTVVYDLGLDSVRLFNELGQAVTPIETTWGAWKAQHPASTLYEHAAVNPPKK